MDNSPSTLSEILGNNNNNKLNRVELKKVCDIVSKKTGLSLDKKKYRMRLSRKIKRQMRKNDITELSTYRKMLQNKKSGQLLDALVEATTVNETLFYRYPKQMRWLTQTFYPNLLQKNTKKIKILSAGCSTGAEPYSIAIALAQAIKDKQYALDNLPFDVQIIGIDINKKILKQGRGGVYKKRPVKNAPKNIQEQYFNSIGERKFSIHPKLKDWVEFKKKNILTDTLPKQNDLILIRNVLIYFDQKKRRRITKRLTSTLKTDSYLVVGHAEDLDDSQESFYMPSTAPRGVYKYQPPKGINKTYPTKDGVRVSVHKKSKKKVILCIEGDKNKKANPDALRNCLDRKLDSFNNTAVCVLDLKEASTLSRKHLRIIKQSVNQNLPRGTKVMVNENKRQSDKASTIFDSPWVTPSKTEQYNLAQQDGKADINNNKKECEAELNVLTKPRVDICPKGSQLVVRVTGQWQGKKSREAFSAMLNKKIKNYSPSSLSIIVSNLDNWRDGFPHLLKRLDDLNTKHYANLTITTDMNELFTTLRDNNIAAKLRLDIGENRWCQTASSF